MLSDIYITCMCIGSYFKGKQCNDNRFNDWHGTEECAEYAEAVYSLINHVGCDYKIACDVVSDLIDDTGFINGKDHGYDVFSRGFLAGEILGYPDKTNIKKAEEAERLWEEDDGSIYGYYQEVLNELISRTNFWSTEINTSLGALKEINKALKVGTTLDDIEDYLDGLIKLGKINVKEYKDIMEYIKEEIEYV